MKESSFPVASGVSIHTRSWQPNGTPRAVMILIHGFNAHSGYMVWPGEQFSANGFATYALDLRGRGQSGGERFFVEKFKDYLYDVDKVVDTARVYKHGVLGLRRGHN